MLAETERLQFAAHPASMRPAQPENRSQHRAAHTRTQMPFETQGQILAPGLETVLQDHVLPRLKLQDLAALLVTCSAARSTVQGAPSFALCAAARRSGLPATALSLVPGSSTTRQIQTAAWLHKRISAAVPPAVECETQLTACSMQAPGLTLSRRETICRFVPQRRALGTSFSPDLSLLCFASLAAPDPQPQWTAAVACGQAVVQLLDARTATVVCQVLPACVRPT